MYLLHLLRLATTKSLYLRRLIHLQLSVTVTSIKLSSYGEASSYVVLKDLSQKSFLKLIYHLKLYFCVKITPKYIDNCCICVQHKSSITYNIWHEFSCFVKSEDS